MSPRRTRHRRATTAAATGLALLLGGCPAGSGDDGVGFDDVPTTIDVTSPAFDDGSAIPERHTCDGPDVSPPLRWSQTPPGAAEIAILMEDQDAPGGTFVHWVVAGVDPAAGGVDEGQAPPRAVEGDNDFGDRGYGGPCPPPDDDPHRYVITVVAASEPLGLEPGGSADDLREALSDTALGQGQLAGTYGR